jgi:hypothetical protein
MVARHIALLLFLIWSAVPAAADPCSDLNSQLSRDLTPSDRLITMVFEALWLERELRNTAAGPLMFTSHSGFSVHPTCDGPVRIRSFVYYPIGLVVRDTGLRQTFSGQHYSLVEAEYGFLLYIRQAHLAPLEGDVTYLFANGNEFPPHCRTAANCLAGSETSGRPSGSVLDPKRRYAVAEAEPTGCEPLLATLYKPGHEILRRADGVPAPREYVPLCRQLPGQSEEEAGRNGQLKIVNKQDYERLFSVPVRGKYERVSGNLLLGSIPNMTNEKPCGQTLRQRTVAEGSAGLEVGGSYFILSGKLAAKLSTSAELSVEYGQQVHLNSSAYILSDIRESEESVAVTLSTHGAEPILTVMNCDPDGAGLLPQSLYMVEVYNDSFGSGPMILAYQDLIGIAQGQANTNVAPGELAGISLASPSARKRGQAWRMEGSFEYFRIRDALRQYVIYQTDLHDILETAAADSATYERNVDYFAHLLLAVTTESRPARRD